MQLCPRIKWWSGGGSTPWWIILYWFEQLRVHSTHIGTYSVDHLSEQLSHLVFDPNRRGLRLGAVVIRVAQLWSHNGLNVHQRD